MKRKIMVVGAAGFVGQEVCQQLVTTGDEVIAVVHDDMQAAFLHHIMPSLSGIIASYDDDFEDVASFHYHSFHLKFDAVVCCVGHCPPEGFREAMAQPINASESLSYIANEIDTQVLCPMSIYKSLLDNLVLTGGHMIFMSSAVTRLLQMPREKRPPIHIYMHLAAIAALDALIEGMRMEAPATLKIHKICPPAIADSPFHHFEGAPKLAFTVTRAQVVQAIMECLEATSHQDKYFQP